MSKTYTRDQLKISVAKILHTLGWNSINSTPLEILTDILGNYVRQITKTTLMYATEFGQTEPNLDHLGLTFRDMGISVQELEEYVTYVNFGPPANPVPKYPISKEDHLNFLKPGSKEVVTRPVHIHEHLPPMNPLLEGNENDNENGIKIEEIDESNTDVFKKPADLPLPRPSIRREEEGSRPTREISSVMMTTSGFLSPAREGKLPESRTPASALEPILPPPSPPPIIEEIKKPPKIIKKIEKKKERIIKQDGGKLTDEKPKKSPNTKSLMKNKQKSPHNLINPFALNSDLKIMPISNSGSSNNKFPSTTSQQPAQHFQQQQQQSQSPTIQSQSHQNKVNKALAAARLKTEKLNTTITPIVIKPSSPQINQQNQNNNNNNNNNMVDKLFSEPDKKKVNIFKKITNVNKNEKDIKIKKEDLRESRESSPDLIIDEPPDDIAQKLSNLPSDVIIEQIIPSTKQQNTIIKKNSPKDIIENPYYDVDDDEHQPGTPTTPKTPEMLSHSPPLIINNNNNNKEKQKKRKENKKQKKLSIKHQISSPNRLDTECIDIDMETRPKTPEAQVLHKMDNNKSFINNNDLSLHQTPRFFNPMPFPFFTNFNPGPGLIPTNPLFSTFPLGLPNFGQKPFIPPPQINPSTSSTITSDLSIKLEESDNKQLPIDLQINNNEMDIISTTNIKSEKKQKEHKKEKKDKIKKRNKKDKIKNKSEKKKLKEEKKEKVKKEKKEKRKDKESKEENQGVKITLRIPSPRPDTPETRKLNIKPIIKKDEDVEMVEAERTRESSPALAKISALVTGPPKPKSTPSMSHSAEETKEDKHPPVPIKSGPGPGRPRIHPIKPKATTKPTKQTKKRSLVKRDADGNEVWICPACCRQDDGSPMIGCDGGCDAWYHWVCVGIQVPPDENEDWYCRTCLLKKNEDLQNDKQKKKRKKKEKKEH